LHRLGLAEQIADALRHLRDGTAVATWATTLACCLVLGCLVLGCDDDAVSPPRAERPSVAFSVCVVKNTGCDPVGEVVWSVLDRPEIPAARTGADGCTTLGGLPPNESLILKWAKAGYFPRIRAVVTGTSDLDFGLEGIPDVTENVEAFEEEIEIDIDMTRPALSVRARPVGAQRETAACNPDPEVFPNIAVTLEDGAAGDLCHFTDAFPDCVTECRGSETDNAGLVTVFNLDEREVRVRVGPESISCSATRAGSDWQLAWTADDGEGFRVPAIDDLETMVTVECEN
jgi:hypothetical protein